MYSIGKNDTSTGNISGLKSGASFSRIALDIEDGLRNPEYVENMLYWSTIEKEEFKHLKTLLIKYEYNLQFYKLLILSFKTLSSFTSISQMLQNAPDLLTEPIVTLLKSKKILLDNKFICQTINYGINEAIKFLIQERKVKRTLATRVENECVTKECITGIKSHISSANNEPVDELGVEVTNSWAINYLKENYIPSVSDILKSEDILNANDICNLIRKSFGISSVNMMPIKILVKHLILGKTVQRKKIILLLYKLKNCLKDIYSETAEDSVEVKECADTASAICDRMKVYKEIALSFKPCLAQAIPTQDICNVCKKIEEFLELQFKSANKEIECSFDEILTCKGREYHRLKERVIQYINDEQVKSSHSFIQGDYDLEEWLSTDEEIESKILGLCSHRDIILERMCRIKMLYTSAVAYSDTLIDLCLDDTSNDLLEQSNCLRSTYKCIKRNISSKKALDSNVVVILKEDMDFIDGEIPILEETLKVLTIQRENIYCSNTTLISDSAAVNCFGFKMR